MAEISKSEKEPEITFENNCPLEEVAALTHQIHVEQHGSDDESTLEESEARIKGFLERLNATELVLRRDGKLVGCAFSFEETEEEIKKEVPHANLFIRAGERVFQIKGVNIKQEYRGQGLGQMIMEKIMAETRQKGATRLFLSTYPEEDNPARRLYEKLGFREVAPNQQPRSFYMQYEYPEEK